MNDRVGFIRTEFIFCGLYQRLNAGESLTKLSQPFFYTVSDSVAFNKIQINKYSKLVTSLINQT